MKKFIIILLVTISCTKEKDLSPTETLTRFYEAISKKDFKEASKYATKQQIETAKFGLDFLGFEGIENYKITILKDSINANICWIKYSDSFTDEKKHSTSKLKKMEGKWKVVEPGVYEKSFFIETIKFPTRKPVK